ncbi:MAG: Hsp70 family protein [Myxococcota bacterium]|nr:Hsp70 family protein [Myxococcota bacterium]MDW8362034.1 Hsp70 family protein [Myxococcales bacterium]
MTAPVVGIDLGTTNSVVAVADGAGARVLRDAEGHALVPSVVAFLPGGEILVGRAARERRLLDARNTVYSVKRLIGRPFQSEEVRRARERFPFELREGPTGGVLVAARGETYTLSEISAFVLREVRTLAERALGTAVGRAVVTVPANFNELQRSATKAAGRVAGLEVLRILNEPTAAALAYGYGRGSRERVAVYDFGGGTFDLTLLDLAGDVFEVLATAGDTYLGGDDIDTLLAEQMADAFRRHHGYDARADGQAFERLRAAAEWAKCRLSEQSEVQLRVEELAYAADGTPLDLTFALTRGALETMIEPLVRRTLEVCEDAMRVAGLRPTQIDNVILVGGSTRIPLVQRLVAEYFGREPLKHLDPDLVVAQGAAIQAASLAPEPERVRRTIGRVPIQRTTVAVARPTDEADAPTVVRPAPSAPSVRPTASSTAPSTATGPARSPAGATTITANDVRSPTGTSRQVTESTDEPEEQDPTIVRRSPFEQVAGPEEPTRPANVSQVSQQPRAVPPPLPTQRAGVPSGRGVPIGGRTLQMAAFDPEAARRAVPPTVVVPGRGAESGAATGAESATPFESVDELATTGSRSSSAPPPRPVDAVVRSTVAAVGQPPPRGPAVPSGPPPGSHGLPHSAVAVGTDRPEVVAPAVVAAATAPAVVTAAASPLGPTADAARMAAPRMPLLLDVTPHTLAIETVGGYCEPVIRRNSTIPVERTRMFATAVDGQDTVRVRICQGESRRLVENQELGAVELVGLRPAPRGEVRIRVTFMLDADGVLGVRAVDESTGREQSVRVQLLGGASEEEVAAMAARHAAATVRSRA